MNIFKRAWNTVKGVAKGVGNVINGAVNFLNRDGVAEEFLSNSFTPNQNAQQYQDINNAWSAEQAQIERDWESPVNQLQMMQQAGLSPATYSSPVSQTSPPTSSSNAHGGTPTLDPVSLLLSSLQMKSLREDVKAKKLANKDKQLELNSKIKGMVDVETEDNWHYDDDGNIVMDISPDTNAYDEDRRIKRNELRKQKHDIEGKKVSNERAKRELALFNDLYDLVKDSNIQQLEALKLDIVTKKLNNSLLSDKVYMLNNYGITSDDKNALTALLRAMLRSPDNLSNVLDAIVLAMRKTGSHIADGVGDLVNDILSNNSSNGSW